MNSKAQVKGKLGDVVQIHVCRLRDSKSPSNVGSLFLVQGLFSDFSVVCITSFGDRAAVRKMERRAARIHRFKPSCHQEPKFLLSKCYTYSTPRSLGSTYRSCTDLCSSITPRFKFIGFVFIHFRRLQDVLSSRIILR